MIRSSSHSLKARLLAAGSIVSLVLATPTQGQVPVRQTDATAFPVGKRIDRSRVIELPVAPSTEREDALFKSLDPSSLTSLERRMVTPPATVTGPPTITAISEDQLTGANFESGRAILLPQAKATLNGIAERLRGKRGLRFEIVGHTDTQRISRGLRATYPDNQALSEARAQAVADFLRDALGLASDRFSPQGFGETQPIASNATLDGMAANRRTIVRALYDEVVEAPPAPPPVPVATLVRRDDCDPSVATKGLPFSISIDGKPLDADSAQTEADRQRCVDVALDRADIRSSTIR